MTVGGEIVPGGGLVDPVTYLVHGLQQRFGQLAEEGQVQIVVE